MKLIKYGMPIIIVILLLAFIIYASVNEGFTNCKCPDGSELKNGGCYICENGYKLSSDYYNPYCVSENKNDYGTGKYVKVAQYKSVVC
jgi:hypothetical protein